MESADICSKKVIEAPCRPRCTPYSRVKAIAAVSDRELLCGYCVPWAEARYTMHLCHAPYYVAAAYGFAAETIVTAGYVDRLAAAVPPLNEAVHYIAPASVGERLPEHEQVAYLRLTIERSHGHAMLPAPNKGAHTSAECFRHPEPIPLKPLPS